MSFDPLVRGMQRVLWRDETPPPWLHAVTTIAPRLKAIARTSAKNLLGTGDTPPVLWRETLARRTVLASDV